MSQEAAPERSVSEQPAQPPLPPVPPVPPQSAGGAPRGLLQQMEELMAALTADLSQLDADFQSSSDRPAAPGRSLREAPAPAPAQGPGQVSGEGTAQVPGEAGPSSAADRTDGTTTA
ncbi:hypothetical protein [Streptomyces sp. NPDC004267]|uniref:hypothetical protein n=1 Tax=Streptomyces sp. NPDC004267 TaxID=3364694 RepID=UPI003691A80E